jgi:NOL1/NOP2/fmu family ribosome biogenesis protein
VSEYANDGSRFDRLPAGPPVDPEPAATPPDGPPLPPDRRPTRAAVLTWWRDRFAIPPDTFADHTFWEKGRGRLWAYAGEATDPATVETLGLPIMRTRSHYWKPSTDAVQRFGGVATRNVLTLGRDGAKQFLAGADRDVPHEGQQGYVVVAHEIGGEAEAIGVGLWIEGELRSMIPKGRRRDWSGK